MTDTIQTLYVKARRGLAQGDAGYWEATEAMAQLSERGESQRAIAAEVGCSQKTVSNYLAVYREYGHTQNKRPSFQQALADHRGPEQPKIPRSPEKRAVLAADLLKDKAVADSPVVKKAVNRAVDRRIKQAAQEWNKEQGIPTRTQKNRDDRRQSVVHNKSFWRDLLYSLSQTARLLNEATGELDRTGLPNGQAGDILKAAALVGRQAETFRKRATVRAVGAPMSRDG